MRTKGLKIAFLTVVLIISIISLSAAAADDVKATNYSFFTKGNVSGGNTTPSPVDLLLGSITGTDDERENLVLLDADNAKTASGSWIKPIPVQFIQILPYLVTILVLAGFVGRSRAPKALGTVFRRA